MSIFSLIFAAFAVLVGAGIGAVFGKRLAVRNAVLDSAAFDNGESVLHSAERRRRIILEEATRTAKEQFEEERKMIEEQTALTLALLEDEEQQLSERQSELDIQANKLEVAEKEIQRERDEIEVVRQDFGKTQLAIEEVVQNFKEALLAKTSSNETVILQEAKEEILSAEKLGISRWLVERQEELKVDARKYASEVLSNVYLRYSPKFVWPKIPFTVELSSKSTIEKHFGDESPLLALLTKGTETTIEVLSSDEAGASKVLKIAGGAGVDKEIIRLSLEEIVSRNVHNLDKVQSIITRNRRNTDKFILKLGEEALKILELPPMHPEILKLIGSLNYRTSHRQNQYFHSLEVARLAGMLADEVGVDPVLAKRSGLLHDIGKVLDWKIEGSHAVISGDYAVKYGEHSDVVDTVLAHHDDKVVETPHAYILKAADAMSGARPGARVDMEDGYQKRIEGIQEVVSSFQPQGVLYSAIMHAGREVHVFVDNRQVRMDKMDWLALEICKKLQSDVQFPGQIKVTLVRRTEVSEVA